MTESDPQTIQVFFSYAHEDEAYRDELAKHLKLLERQNVISAWHDREIAAGEEWKKEILDQLNQADIILLLISSDFMASDFCWDTELERAMERHENKEAVVIPIIVREVDWSSAIFAKLQALPKNAEAIANWPIADQAYADISRGIKKVAIALKK